MHLSSNMYTANVQQDTAPGRRRIDLITNAKREGDSTGGHTIHAFFSLLEPVEPNIRLLLLHPNTLHIRMLQMFLIFTRIRDHHRHTCSLCMCSDAIDKPACSLRLTDMCVPDCQISCKPVKVAESSSSCKSRSCRQCGGDRMQSQPAW